MPAHLKTVQNMTKAELELAFIRCRNNLKTVGNLTVKDSLQNFDAKEMYLHHKNRLVSFQKSRKCSVFIIFVSSHDASSKMYRLGSIFKNHLAKYVPYSCEREADPTHFLLFSKCAGFM